jgi:integrase
MARPEIILDKKKMTTTGPDTGRYHIKIRAYFPVLVDGEKVWKPRFAKTDVFATEDEFEVMPGSRAKVVQAKYDVVKAKLRKAEGICKDVKRLTGDQFIMLMDGAGNYESITGMFDFYISECLKENEAGEARDGNAIVLKNARDFFIRYKGSDQISYAEITREWLEGCRRWAFSEIKDAKDNVIKKPVSPSTFSMYCRALQTIMNMAQYRFNKISKDSIPFGKGKFKISAGKKKRKIKLELPTDKLIAEKNKILSFVAPLREVKDDEGNMVKKPVFPSLDMYLNYWKASYFGNGANMADVLRWKIGEYNKEASIILFERKKTANTEEENEAIMVLVGDELKEIIAIEGNKSLDPEEYIFPVLKRGMSSAERKQAVLDFIRLMNRSLARAAKEMSLQVKLSAGSARYLSSTILDRLKVSKEDIAKRLGHADIYMQNHYVSQDEIETQTRMLKLLRQG